MALNLANVETTDTFQTWYTRTNEILRDAFPTSGGTITGNLTVTGNASFIGNTTLVSVTELTSRDAILHLGANNASDIVDLGVVASYVRGDGQNTHTGFIRDSGTKEIYFLDEAGTGQGGQPFNSFNPNAVDTVLANVHVRKLTGASVSLSGGITASGSVSASAFIGDGSQLTNAGSTVASETGAASDRDLLVPFTGIQSGTMTSANVDSNFTYNPSSGLFAANTVKTSDLQDSSGRTLTIRDESGTIVWGG